MAYVGHPILGDGKYGTNAINRAFNLKQQALWACRLKFSFTGKSTVLDYLNGKEIKVEPGFDTSPFRK
jgi:23S rRNA pseudouridine955/2504/2580 synthase